MRISKIKLAELEDLSQVIIRGFEGEGDGAAGGSGDTGGEGTGGEGGDTGGEGDDTGGGDDDGVDDDGDLPDDNAELKTALRKARLEARAATKAAKKATRDATRLQKAEEDKKTAEKGEVEAATKKASEAAEKATKLAGKLRQTSLEAAIKDAATKAKFRDPDDVITQLSRSDFAGIEIDQDEDDPSDIDIDLKSVEKAVKAVATAKPHWLIAAGDTNNSGSSFNGGKPSGGSKNKNAEYAQRFPALRNKLPQS